MITCNIKRFCKERSIKLSDLEKAVGLGENTIYKWAKCSPSVSKLKAVADYFGCTIDDLLKEE